MSKIGIVCPVLNNFRGFTELVESAKSEGFDLQWYVQPQHRTQVPLAAAWNKGFRDAVADGCKYVAILNDDILLAPGTLDNLALALEVLPMAMLVSANNLHGQLNNPYDILTHAEISFGQSTPSEHPNYSCFMVKRDFFDKVGSFDENFNPAWYEDNSSHRSIVLAGYKAYCTTYASCIHYGSVTSNLLPPEKRDSSASRAYYIKKWGGIPVSHPGEEPKEHFEHPYNNPNLAPGKWVPDYMGRLERGEINEQGDEPYILSIGG